MPDKSGGARDQRGGIQEIRPTKLYSHRANVDEENAAQLRLLPGTLRCFRARDGGVNKEQAEKNFIVPFELSLKEGAQVILLKNLDPPVLVNGSRGVVVRFETATEALLREEKRFDGVSMEVEYPVVMFGKCGS